MSPPPQRVKTPSEGIKTPSEGVKTPSEGVKIPSEGVKTPSEGVKIPSEDVICHKEQLSNWKFVSILLHLRDIIHLLKRLNYEVTNIYFHTNHNKELNYVKINPIYEIVSSYPLYTFKRIK